MINVFFTSVYIRVICTYTRGKYIPFLVLSYVYMLFLFREVKWKNGYMYTY